MDIALEISHYVLIIGGALCVIMLFILLFYILLFFVRAKRLVKNVQQTYQQALFMIFTPMNKIKKWLWEEEEEE